MATTTCPCGSEQAYKNCCEIFISGKELPKTPEQLMRSRYTAYTNANVDYIAETMRPPASNDFDKADSRQWAKSVKWKRLEVITAQNNKERGQVEFIAHFTEKDETRKIHEVAEFHFIKDRWFYVDGEYPAVQPIVKGDKVSRNDPCPCGSGKKYKKCCSK